MRKLLRDQGQCHIQSLGIAVLSALPRRCPSWRSMFLICWSEPVDRSYLAILSRRVLYQAADWRCLHKDARTDLQRRTFKNVYISSCTYPSVFSLSPVDRTSSITCTLSAMHAYLLKSPQTGSPYLFTLRPEDLLIGRLTPDNSSSLEHVPSPIRRFMQRESARKNQHGRPASQARVDIEQLVRRKRRFQPDGNLLP
jgi:hypothetical protein